MLPNTYGQLGRQAIEIFQIHDFGQSLMNLDWAINRSVDDLSPKNRIPLAVINRRDASHTLGKDGRSNLGPLSYGLPFLTFP